jgi:two-component system sensor histidine kinase EvgS
LIADFLGATRDDIDALRKALGANDAAGVTREAHRIRGASGLVGAVALSTAAAGIEAAGRSDNLALVRAKLAELDAAVKQFAENSGVEIV